MSANSFCITKGCQNDRPNKGRICHRCTARRQKETNHVGYTFNILKQNAKYRGKEFYLTLSEFKQWCKQTNYLTLKGKTKGSMTIDRIRNSQGYSLNNIQIMEHTANSTKRDIDDYFGAVCAKEDLPF